MERRAKVFYSAGTAVIFIAATMAMTSFADDVTIPMASAVTATTLASTPVTITLAGASQDIEAGGTLSVATTTSPAHGTLSMIAGQTLVYTPESGFTGTDSFSYIATEGATSSPSADVSITVSAPTPTTGTAHIAVRDGATLIALADVSFALEGTMTVSATTGETHDIAASSTLAILAALDVSSSAFDITDLQYNTGFGAFYLRCITLSGSAADCDNWQYTVNGIGPAVGMDTYTLHDGDTVYVYYGYPRIVSLSATTTDTVTPVVATAEQYDPALGAYAAVTGYTIGVTQPDPSNPWNPTEIATSTVDSSGTASFTIATAGTYDVGIQEDYYYPTITLAVTDVSTSTTTTTTNIGSGGGGGGSGTPPKPTFSLARALSFLAAHQNADGSFANPVITDWAALAFGATVSSTAGTKLHDYLATVSTPLASVTDYERHALALEALGINPYSGSPLDTISPIVTAYDGTQIGSASLDNDDIFALLALQYAGYTQQDDIIRKTAVFVISKQKADGSWDASADMTAAAIQALGALYTVPGYGPALGKAQGYLAAHQQTTGGWDNADSTSWVLSSITSVREGDPTHAGTWTTAAGYTPEDSLATVQQSDGSVRPASEPTDTRVWSTAYAAAAMSGHSWLSTLHAFSRPQTATNAPSAALPTTIDTGAATTTATSTTVASTTDEIAATTPTIAPAPTTATTTHATSTPARHIVRHVVHPAATPAPTHETPTPIVPVEESQTAAAVTAGGSFISRLFSWVARWFHW